MIHYIILGRDLDIFFLHLYFLLIFLNIIVYLLKYLFIINFTPFKISQRHRGLHVSKQFIKKNLNLLFIKA